MTKYLSSYILTYMPNVSTYIRTEDLSKYLEIAKDKGAWTEFIHNALKDGVVGATSFHEGTMLEPGVSPKGSPLKDKISHAPTKTTDYNSPPSKAKLCKHGNPKGLCRDKQALRMKCNV